MPQHFVRRPQSAGRKLVVKRTAKRNASKGSPKHANELRFPSPATASPKRPGRPTDHDRGTSGTLSKACKAYKREEIERAHFTAFHSSSDLWISESFPGESRDAARTKAPSKPLPNSATGARKSATDAFSGDADPPRSRRLSAPPKAREEIPELSSAKKRFLVRSCMVCPLEEHVPRFSYVELSRRRTGLGKTRGLAPRFLSLFISQKDFEITFMKSES